MNHLGCDGNMKVVFDAGDAKLECVEEEDEEEDAEEEEGIEVDIAKLRGELLPTSLTLSEGIDASSCALV